MKATKKQAEWVISQVKKMYPGHDFKNLQINDTWEPGSRLVAWEEGPYEWTFEASWKIGEMLRSNPDRTLFIECQNSWALVLYQDSY